MPWRRMGEWRYSSTILDLVISWRWAVSFTLWPLCARGKLKVEVLYDWRFTVNHFISEPSHSRLTIRLFFAINPRGHSPYVTSSLRQGCYWKFFLVHCIQVPCQSRLCRADHAYLSNNAAFCYQNKFNTVTYGISKRMRSVVITCYSMLVFSNRVIDCVPLLFPSNIPIINPRTFMFRFQCKAPFHSI
jgi:hypothetical protein